MGWGKFPTKGLWVSNKEGDLYSALSAIVCPRLPKS